MTNLIQQIERVVPPERVKEHAAKLNQAFAENERNALTGWFSTFLDYQLQWLLDPSRFMLWLKGRQIGASHTNAATAVWWALLGETTYIVSIGLNEATEVLGMAHKHAQILESLGSKWSKVVRKTGTKLELASGGKVIAVPSTSGGRGYSGNVILDEVAYYESRSPELIWESAGGAAIHGHKLRALSTPNGVGNFWHDIWSNPRRNKGYKKHFVTMEDALTDGIHDLSGQTPEQFREAVWALARGDARTFAQMTECTFLDTQDQLLPTATVQASRITPCRWPAGFHYAGLDIGRTADRTELVIVRKAESDGEIYRRWMVFNESRKRTNSEDLDNLVRIALGPPFYCQRICVDATGMGSFPAEDLQRRYGRSVIEPVVFTLKSKEELATGMYTAFTQDRVRIPADDRQLFEELCSIRREVTDAGNIRYVAPSTVNGHADRAWALSLALHACKSPRSVRIEIGPEPTLG